MWFNIQLIILISIKKGGFEVQFEFTSGLGLLR